MKTSFLKVDNFRHISDHGLAVVFTGHKLASLVQYLRDKPSGETRLTAGHSTLTIRRFGHVTQTVAFFSVGSCHIEGLHYFDATVSPPLSFSVHSNKGDAERAAYQTLCSVIIGKDRLPGVWTPANGAKRDESALWLRTHAWTLLGESAMRAKATDKSLATLQATIAGFANEKAYLLSEKGKIEGRTPEVYREQHDRLRAHIKAAGEFADTKEAQLNETIDAVAQCAATLAVDPLHTEEEASNRREAEARLSDIAQAYGANSGRVYDYTANAYVEKGACFAAVGQRVSPEYVRPNYRASVSQDGQITLSSGIVCTFSLADLKGWLKGEAAAPHTRYGTVSKVETRDEQNNAKVLLRCGCHLIDAVSAAPELAELLKPTHTVSIVPGTPEAQIGTPEFFTILRQKIERAREQIHATRASKIANSLQNRKELTAQEANQPQVLADIAQRLETAQAKELEAKIALETARAQASSGTVETFQKIAVQALNSLLPQALNL
jgi:hypothetical protein